MRPAPGHLAAHLAALPLVLLAACGGADAPAGRPAPAQRLLVVGWDGASFRMIAPLLAQGKLPNVERLIERGVAAELLSTVVPISSAAWVAAASGQGPGETGVYGFFEPVPGSYDVGLVSARSNHAAPLWRILTRDGLSSIVFGVPLTYPPEPILGTLVAGMLAPRDSVYTWPAALAEELRARDYDPGLEPWLEPTPIDWPIVEHHLAQQRQILLELLAHDDWSLAFAVFKSLDVVSHLSYEVDFAAQVTPLYECLDAILGDLVEAAGEGTNVMLVSDHGFHTYRAGFNLHAWLLERGWSVRKEKVKRFAIKETDPLAKRERDIVRQLRNELDWSRTRAFSFVCEGNCGALRLNLAGREPEGVVAPGEVDGLLSALAADLREHALDDQGKPIVRRVLETRALYPGPHRDALPDLVFEVDPELQVFADPEESELVGAYPGPLPDHDLWGIFVAAGPSIAHTGSFTFDLARRAELEARAFAGPDEASPRPPTILDLAPTALHLLDRPVPASMQGRVLTELLRGLGPPRIGGEEPGPAGAPPLDAPFTPEQIEELEAHLRALGYH